MTNVSKFNCLLIASLVAAAACGGDKTKDDAKAAVERDASPDQYRKRQQAFADSVLNTSKPTAKVVEQLGKGYAIGSVQLRDTIAALAAAAPCYKSGRDADPYLAGTVSVLAHMAPIGIDLIQVQESGTQWTSPAGNLVNACLTTEMKKWKLDMSYGKPAAYIVQVQFKTDSVVIKKPDTAAAPAAKKAAAKKPVG